MMTLERFLAGHAFRIAIFASILNGLLSFVATWPELHVGASFIALINAVFIQKIKLGERHHEES